MKVHQIALALATFACSGVDGLQAQGPIQAFVGFNQPNSMGIPCVSCLGFPFGTVVVQPNNFVSSNSTGLYYAVLQTAGWSGRLSVNFTLTGAMDGSRSYFPRSFVCSSVDILPFIYSLAFGNETWRCNYSDIIHYLAGRESIMDAFFMGSSVAQQRRLSGIPTTNPDASHQYQPYILHTMDEYYNLTSPQNHAVAYRTVDNTVSSATGGVSETGPFGGGKLGLYRYWVSCGITPDPNRPTQYEFYNYQLNAPANSPPNLQPNLGELGNDWWASNGNTSGNSPAQGLLYKNDFFTANVQNELTYIYAPIAQAHSNALTLWLTYLAILNSTQTGGPCSGTPCNA